MLVCGLGVVVALGAGAAGARGQEDSASDPEKQARRERQGAGLRGGIWDVRDLTEVSGAKYSTSPAFEGYFQKGLDLHLAIESTAGVWRRRQTMEQDGGLGGGTVREEVNSYVVPLFTALKLYPFTRPDDAFEPFVSAGVGLALGIDDRTTTSSDLLGLGAGSGTAMLTGFGFRGGAGVEWRFSQAFGLSASGRYQWIRFGGELGGERTFKGPAFEAGLTYRFQYR